MIFRYLTLTVLLMIVVFAQAKVISAENAGNAPDGARIFKRYCAPCHGQEGRGTKVGPSLQVSTEPQAVIQMMRTGKGIMPTFKDKLTEAQMQAVAHYVSRDLAGGR
jgi:mono/diheme cytochrome c family protein